jgi:hypothetical protein
MLSALIGVLIIVLECLRWLKTGVWEAATLHNALEWVGRAISIDEFDSGSRGLDKIVHLVLHGTLVFNAEIPSYLSGVVGGVTAIPIWEFLKRVGPSRKI